MKRTGYGIGIWAGVLVLGVSVMGAVGAWAQEDMPAPSPIEKTLAERAEHVTEVTLDKNMLALAGKFMGADKDDDSDDKAVKAMIQGLKGVYVREYEFKESNAYSADELEGLRKYMAGASWSPMVHERTKGSKEGTDVYLKMVDGQIQGLFVLDAEDKELSLVLILGPIDMNEIGKMGGKFGIPKDAMKDAKKAQKGGTK